jgi:hypothetical protein
MDTEAKARLVNHVNTLTLLIKRSANILQPVSSAVPTTVAEGQVLARLILSSLVDNYEIYLLDLMLGIYLTKLETLKSGRQFSADDILNCNGWSEVVRLIARKRVEEMERGGLEGFARAFDQSYQFKLFTTSEEPMAKRLFAIRNLYTHQNGRVDEKFLKQSGLNLPLGSEHQLSVDELVAAVEFLLNAIDRLDQAAIAKYQLNTVS